MTIIIGVGNAFRRDDGAGPAVVDLLRGRVDATLAVTDGEPARLIELWDGADLAIVVDAVRSEPAVPGRLHELRLDAVADGLPGTGPPPGGSHALGLADAVELGRAVGQMPDVLEVLAIEGGDFGLGPGLTGPVAATVRSVAAGLARRGR